jgi:hypothetical protein
MRRSVSVLVSVASTFLITACSEMPSSTRALTAGGGGDTSQVAPDRVDLSGRVLAMQANPGGMGGDTLRSVPIGGVTLKLMHNIIVDGASAQELTGTTVSGSDGRYHFNGIPGGYYVLYAYPSVSSGYQGSYSLVPAQAASVTIDVYVWKQ